VRGDRDRILDMVEMYDLVRKQATAQRKLTVEQVTQAAAQRWIEIIGDAASHVTDEVKTANPDVAWREMSGIRIILAHGYFHIEDDIIGNVDTNDIPVLRRQLQAILDTPSDTD